MFLNNINLDCGMHLNQLFIVAWIGTLSHDPPDMLMGYRFYSYPVDIWSFGCILGAILFNRTYMFEGWIHAEVLNNQAKV